MTEVIAVDFKKKKKIEKYVIKELVCAGCLVLVSTDSRKKVNPPYIPLSGGKNQCLCKDCSVSIASLIKSEGWDNE